MPQFSNVTYSGTYSGAGSGSDPTLGSYTITTNGALTAMLSEDADGNVSGTWSYSGGYIAWNSLGSESGSVGDSGSVSGTEGNLTFTSDDGVFVGGTGTLSGNDTVLTMSAGWSVSGGSGSASGSMVGAVPSPTSSEEVVLLGDTPTLLEESNPSVPAPAMLQQSSSDANFYASPPIASDFSAIGTLPVSGGENSVFSIIKDAIIDTVKGAVIEAAKINEVPFAEYAAGVDDVAGVGSAMNGTAGGATNFIQQGVSVEAGQESVSEFYNNYNGFLVGQNAQYKSMAAGELASQVPGVGWALGPLVSALTKISYLLQGNAESSSTSENAGIVGASAQPASSFQVDVTLDSTISLQQGGIVLAGDQYNDISLGTGDALAAGGGAGDTFIVGQGDDILLGEGGIETAVFAGALSSYTITTSAGSVLISGAGYVDTLDAITLAQFANGVVAILPGVTASATVSSGGTLLVLSGGTADPTTVLTGGSELVSAGGTAISATIDSGASQIVQSGALASGIILNGGSVIIAGGTAALAGGTALRGAIDFSGSGTLDIGGTAMPSTVISGFGLGDAIDLTGIAFDSAASAVLEAGNVLQISGGGQTADLDFDPSQDLAGEQFFPATDAEDGTEIILRPSVTSGQTDYVSASRTSSGVIVDSGGALDVQSAGTARATVVSGGTVSVASGGIASGTIIDSGGTEQIGVYLLESSSSGTVGTGTAGGAAYGTIVNLGGVQHVEWGIASATVVSGGSQIVEGNGSAIAATVEAGGVQQIGVQPVGALASAGYASATVVGSGGTLLVTAGTAYGVTIDSGGSVVGNVDGTVVDNGTWIANQFNGSSLSGSGMLVVDGGTADILPGGGFAGTLSDDGGTLEFEGPGALGAAAIVLGGSPDVLEIVGTLNTIGFRFWTVGNVISGFVPGDLIEAPFGFSSGGSVSVSSANVLQVVDGDSHLTLSLQPNQLFVDETFQLSSGSHDATVVLNAQPVIASAVIADGDEYGLPVAGGGIAFVLSGGTATGSVVSSGGEQYVGSQGSSLAAQIESFGAEVLFGTDSGADLSGTQYDFGTASGGTTYAGGFQLVAPGAVASGMMAAFGGEQYVGSGGTALGTEVGSGGAEVVFGTDSGASLSGTQYDFGAASGGTASNDGYQLVASGALAVGMTVESGGEQYIGSGGTAIATIIAAAGAQVVFGSALGAAVSGTQYDFGYASGGTTYNQGFQEVASAAVAIGMTVLSGGMQYIGAGGTARATSIAAQGAEVVFGRDSGALVSGTQYLFGVASGGIAIGGGSQQVQFGGTAIGMTVSSGGEQDVGAGGTAIGTTIMSQGAEVVHGTDLGAIVSGTQYVYGLASGTVAATGGYQLVSAGGTISAVSISGGTIELQSGASAGTTPITFAAAGDLLLDASASFSGTVAGFGAASLNDTIDFADIPYVAGATTVSWSQLTSGAGASGTLMVGQGGHSADIALLGQYVAQNFTLSNDGNGGTLVTDPPATVATDPNPQVLTLTRQA